ncbi:unnamed protein product [Ixodes pacificus]
MLVRAEKKAKPSVVFFLPTFLGFDWYARIRVSCSVTFCRQVLPVPVCRLPRSVQDPGEVVHRFADKMCGGGLAWLMRVENPTRTANGFPAIFDEAVTPRGLISKHPREKNTGVALVPSLVCVQSGSGTARGLREVGHAGSSLDLQRFHRCTLAGTEPDAFREALNAVQELASDYDLGL